jgi:hypothetical protein
MTSRSAAPIFFSLLACLASVASAQTGFNQTLMAPSAVAYP